MFLQSRNEQKSPRAVKAMMVRAKLTLFCILPALWLFVCAKSLCVQCSDCANQGPQSSTLALHKGKQCSTDISSTQDISARRTQLRLLKSGKDNSFPLAFLSTAHGAEPRPSVSPPRHFGPQILAARWQFDLRAAPDVRAPSSLS